MYTVVERDVVLNLSMEKKTKVMWQFCNVTYQTMFYTSHTLCMEDTTYLEGEIFLHIR